MLGLLAFFIKGIGIRTKTALLLFEHRFLKTYFIQKWQRG